MKEIHQFLKSQEEVKSIIGGFTSGMKEQLAAGLSGSARSLLISVIEASVKRPILLVTHQLIQAQQLYDHLTEFTKDNIYLYPVNEFISSEIAAQSPELRSQRIDALTEWMNKKSGILIAPVAALRRILPPKDYWGKYQLPFTVGATMQLETYLAALVDMGYERTSMVTTPGEFSQRGGIIDIYPVTEERPLRIE